MIQILQQTEDYYIFDKPAGVNFHDHCGNDGFLSKVRSQLNEPDLLPVHRLDRETSGLILVARNANAAKGLSALFAERKVEKYYVAVSDRKPKKKQGWIRGGMKRSRRGTWRLTRDKEHFAITRFVSRSFEGSRRLFLLRLYTGRTHQVRVALRSLGSPILGDSLYETGNKNTSDRMYLHAFGLCFEWHGKLYRHILLPNNGLLFLQGIHNGDFELWTKPWELF